MPGGKALQAKSTGHGFPGVVYQLCRRRRKVCHVMPWKADINPNLRCCSPKLQPAIEAPLHQTATRPQPV
ncbi:hypothetical protein TIFTF001_033573 [Ficus carica]|uniref:Uncharacterized protein n=1 Tax=Ficus carica TaxID=3494 RepID=A0AA88E105_FICCA|nr:hypothetical protein TIFTF001_033573 [Ficus carica]